jgi:hypothetical protein
MGQAISRERKWSINQLIICSLLLKYQDLLYITILQIIQAVNYFALEHEISPQIISEIQGITIPIFSLLSKSSSKY